MCSKKSFFRLCMVLSLILVFACSGGKSTGPVDPGSNTNTDVDTNTDSGMNQDSDTDSSTDTDNPDIEAPQVSIDFPPPLSATEGNTIIVTGSATDDSGISSVRINGVDATSSDSFATWQAVVNLNPGLNSLIAEVTDTANKTGNSNNSVTINAYGPEMIQASDIALDSANNRALVVDSHLKVLFSVDLTAGPRFGARSVISSNTVPNENNPFGQTIGVALDTENQRALISDNGRKAVIAVNLVPGDEFGERTIVSDNTMADIDNPFITLSYLAIDSDNNRVLVADEGADAIFAVDLSSGPGFGNRTVVTNPTTPDDRNVISTVSGVAVDSANSTAYVTDIGFNELYAVDLRPGPGFGSRTIIEDKSDSGILFATPRAVAIDTDNNRALISDSGRRAIFAIDLAAGPTYGNRSVISDNNTVASTPLDWVRGLDIDPVNEVLLVSDINTDIISKVDLAPGDTFGSRSIASSNSTPNSINAFREPVSVVLDSENNRAFVLDFHLDTLFSVDLTPGPNYGARSIVSDPQTPDTINPFVGARDMVLDSDNERMLVVDKFLPGLVAVDLTPGENFGKRSIISDNNTPDTNNPFNAIEGIVLDSANNRALIVDDADNALFAVDLHPDNLGARSVVSNDIIPNELNPFNNPREIVLDSANSRALVSDESARALIAVNLSDGSDFGARTIVSDNTHPDNVNPLLRLEGLILDSGNNRALISEKFNDVLLAVDLTPGPSFGSRTIVSGEYSSDNINSLDEPVDMVLSNAGNQIFLIDEGLRALVAVDLTTGQRVFISR